MCRRHPALVLCPWAQRAGFLWPDPSQPGVEHVLGLMEREGEWWEGRGRGGEGKRCGERRKGNRQSIASFPAAGQSHLQCLFTCTCSMQIRPKNLVMFASGTHRIDTRGAVPYEGEISAWRLDASQSVAMQHHYCCTVRCSSGMGQCEMRMIMVGHRPPMCLPSV